MPVKSSKLFFSSAAQKANAEQNGMLVTCVDQKGDNTQKKKNLFVFFTRKARL